MARAGASAAAARRAPAPRPGIQATTTSAPSKVITAEMRVVMCMACTKAESAKTPRSRPAMLPEPSFAATAWVASIDPVAAPLAAAGSAPRCGLSWPR